MRMLTRNTTQRPWSRTTVVPRASGTISPIGRKSKRPQQQPQKAPSSSSQPSSSGSSRPSLASVSGTNYDILEAFFYGRAFASVLSKRLGEAVVDAVAEVSRAAAERPQRIRDFKEEVQALVRKEMSDAGAPVRNQEAGSSGSSSNGKGGASGKEPEDLQAVVDDLRAEIAYSRAILQQMRTGGKSGAPPSKEGLGL